MSSKLYYGDNLQVLREHVASASFYATDHGQYPRLKFFTIADLLEGKLPRIPFGYSEGYKRAAREKEEKQGLLI